MGFFDLPPEPEPNAFDDGLEDFEDYGEGRWLLGLMSIGQFIGYSDRAAVAALEIAALPDGFGIEILAWLRHPPKRQRMRFGPWERDIRLAGHGPYGFRDENGQIAEEFVRFGVQFPDGGRATNLDFAFSWPDATKPMHGMEPQGGSSSRGEAEQSFWVWPVPPAGDIMLVCEWPAYGISESRLVVDGDELRAAAARARPVWPGDTPPEQTGGARAHAASFRSRMAMRRRAVDVAMAQIQEEPGEDADETGAADEGPRS